MMPARTPDWIMLDRRIAEERLIALDPPFVRPEWLWQYLGCGFVPNAFTMGVDGAVAALWTPADEVDWSTVVAVRFEAPWGSPLTVPDMDDDEDCA